MIEDVMTFLPKPERNGIWVFAHDAPARIGRQDRAHLLIDMWRSF
jgi:hypothetical protein